MPRNVKKVAGGSAALGNTQPVSFNVHPFLPPFQMVLPHATVTVKVANAMDADGRVPLTLTTNATALYVTLTTVVSGRFSDNAFLLLASGTEPAANEQGGEREQGARTGSAQAKNGERATISPRAANGAAIYFIPWGAFGAEQHALLRSSLRVEHLQDNL